MTQPADCPRDGKKLRNGVCLFCGYTAPDATMSGSRNRPGPDVATAGPGWRGRQSAGSPGGANPGPPNPTASNAPSPPTSAVPQPVSATTGPVSGAGSAAPGSATVPARGRVRVTGTIIDVSPERTETVGLRATNALRQALLGILTFIPRAIGMSMLLMLAMFAPRLGGAAMGLRAGRRSNPRQQRQESASVPGTPFEVDADDGRSYECYLRGEIRGGAIRLGDQVQLRGRISSRTGVLEVVELFNARTGATTRGYVDPAARMIGVRIAFQVMMLAFIIYLVVFVVRVLSG